MVPQFFSLAVQGSRVDERLYLLNSSALPLGLLRALMPPHAGSFLERLRGLADHPTIPPFRASVGLRAEEWKVDLLRMAEDPTPEWAGEEGSREEWERWRAMIGEGAETREVGLKLEKSGRITHTRYLRPSWAAEQMGAFHLPLDKAGRISDHTGHPE